MGMTPQILFYSGRYSFIDRDQDLAHSHIRARRTTFLLMRVRSIQNYDTGVFVLFAVFDVV